ncbi:MAG: 4Fe-4S dicluster domain-containing protein [Deltaproteobacteria bacterium]|jgi:DMSO reductase iron-sulfur subunit|nr:4Fe-4S dicluster domain-containing protein [Deltaproteobacteria bacterium]
MVKQYGFFVDMSGCYGCKTCTMACVSENTTSKGVLWRKVREFNTDDPSSGAFLSMSCNHCDNPQCLNACPANAYNKRPDGIVVQDHERCIGCRMCVMACPYNAPVFDPDEGKTSKCNLCAERLDEGLAPRCVESCPAAVLRYGEIDVLRQEYGASLARIVDRYKFPDPSVIRPNIVIIPARMVP